MHFRFKKFTVRHDRSPQKIGADSVSLGALVEPDTEPLRMLDPGCGCGILALMMAQRFPKAQITALELDPEALKDARENFENSPWNDRIELVAADIRNWQTDSKYDLIVCNPPYFVNAVKPVEEGRSRARHEDGFSEALFKLSASNLHPKGQLSIITPVDREAELSIMAKASGLLLQSSLDILPARNKKIKRTIVHFGFEEKQHTRSHILMEEERHHYAPAYQKLVEPFYLKL